MHQVQLPWLSAVAPTPHCARSGGARTLCAHRPKNEDEWEPESKYFNIEEICINSP